MAGMGGLMPQMNFKKGDHARVPTSSRLKDALKQLEDAKDDNEVKKGIKELVKLYSYSKEKKNKILIVETRLTILEFFTKYNNKRLFKKFLTDQVTKSNLVQDIIKTQSQYILDKIKETVTCDLKLCNEFLHFISIVQTAPNYDYESNYRPLFPLYMALFDSFAIYASQIKQDVLPEIEELNVLMNLVLKQILPVFVKHPAFLQEIKDKYVQTLLMFSYILLFNGKLGFDMRMKVCLIFVYSFSVLEGDNLSVSQLIGKDSSQFSWSTNDSIPADYHIILYSAILNVLPEEKLLSEKVDGKPLVCVLYEGFMESTTSQSGNAQVIIETSKTLCQIAKHLKKVPVEYLEDLFLQGLFYVWSHSEHRIDTVRTYAKIFFDELCGLAASYHIKGYSALAETLLQKIAEIPDTSNLKFFAYENLASHFGCNFLLQSCHKLPEALLEFMEFPTIKEQVCKTYINLLEIGFRTADQQDKDNLYTEWAKTWVFPVVQSLNFNKVCREYYQRIITSAFNLQPAILRMIYPNDFVGSTGESAILLHCLQHARKAGIELNVEKECNLYWRGLIDKQKMEMFMIHQDEQIRLLVLAAITESLKSTALFLDWEFIFLINYIRYNITAQSPNVRKQIISYYKKVLARFDAGYRVILRNIDQLTKHLHQSSSSTTPDTAPPKNIETTIENKVVNKNKILLTDNHDQREFLCLYQELKKSYRRFICNLTKILIGNLSYDSNYPRRATSLELLLVIKDILSSDEWKNCWTEDDVKSSHNILFDTYENNKKMVVLLLRTVPPHYLGFMNVHFTLKYLQRSFELASDVKPSKTLSAAYLFEMCTYSPHFYKIIHCTHKQEEHTEACEPNKEQYDPTLDMVMLLTKEFLNHASEINLENFENMSKSSIYGFILSVRHLLESRDLSKENAGFAGIFEHLIAGCFEIQTKIMPVVCNQSPEGYLPENSEDICEADETSRAQMTLVYAWRTMKEIMLLLAEIVKQCIKLESEIEMLPEHSLIQIGEFFVNVFVQSKHRGVFEQAYVGFSVICEKFWISKKDTINCLPKKWLEYALDLCTGKQESDGLISTRRSAGLPFFMLSMLTTIPEPQCFHSTMEALLACAKNYEKTPNDTRMHCLNVLRAIYRHSKLGESVGSYVGQGVILAINGYKSEDWGVRNSSTLLYATLITRMFGVQRTTDSEDLSIKNKLTLRIFHQRYPELYTFLLSTLSSECEKSDSLVLHPILMILGRLYASSFEANSSEMEKWLPHVSKCLSNPVFTTRDLAARASVPLIDLEKVNDHCEGCFKKITETNDISDNECHGILLQVQHLIKNNTITDFPQSHYLASALCGDRLWNEVGHKFSFMTVNLFTDIVTHLLVFCGDFEDLHWLKEMVLNLSRQMRRNQPNTDWRSKFGPTRFVLAYYIMINKLEETDMTFLTITHEIMAYMYGQVPSMKKFSLYLMIALNQTLQLYLDPSNFKLHPLFSTKDVEIPPEVANLVATFDRLTIEKILKNIHPYIKAFLMEELKREHYVKDTEERVLMFLLLDFYPCAIRFLRLSKQETLNTFLGYCDCDNEELISAVLSCVSTFLSEVDYNLLRYDKLIEVLSKSASPAALVHRRLAVSDFLCKNYYLYCNDEPILRGDQLRMVFSIGLVLLEDDDCDVRNGMSNFENALKVRIKIDNSANQMISGHRWPVVPEKAKEDLIHLATVLLPDDEAVCFVFSWACRYFQDPSGESNEYEIFERGGLNPYAENTPLIDMCSRVLIKKLWALPDGVSFGDRSIFLEEQTQAVTLALLNALMKFESPMMLHRTKVSVICVLKSLYKFLENTQISDKFANQFRTYLSDTILNYLTAQLEHGDLYCVKKMIRKLYDPVFRYRK